MNRLSIVHTEASLGWGGQEIRILAESQGLMRRGHDVPPDLPAGGAHLRRGARLGPAGDRGADRHASGWPG